MNEEPIQEGDYRQDKKFAWVTVVLTVSNVLVFLVQFFVDNQFYEFGALSLQRIVGFHEFYRLLTCMFLHGGIEHIFSNMLILYYLGQMLERAIGSYKYMALYFIAGIGSGLASMLYEYVSNTVIYTVGASGAIYGIIGAMLFLVIIHKGRYGDITLRRMIFAILYMLYVGMRDTSVNNAAHIGGLCIGFLTIYVMYMVVIRREGR